MGIQKDVLVYSAADFSAALSVGSNFTVTGAPDLMAFKDDETSQSPADFNPANGDIDPSQTLSGTLDGTLFTGINGTTDVFEFELAFQVTDGVDTFNIYQIDNDLNGGIEVAYVSEVALDPNASYTVIARDDGANFANGGAFETTPTYSDLAGQVDGTSSDDVINAGFVDDDDDSVDGDDGDVDYILGEGGGDTITSGAGDDVVYGDHSDDLPAGTTEYIAQGFIRDVNFKLESGSLGNGTGSVSISGAPLEIRFIDNDAVLNGDTGNDEQADDVDQLVEINGVLYNYSADYLVRYSGSDGQLYEMAVLDVDRDASENFVDYDPTTDPGDVDYEDGQILIPNGAVPPANITLSSPTFLRSLDTETYSTLNGAAEVTNYDDTIDAGAGNDMVFGGRGDDTITGGAGADALSGGTGADEFIVDDGGDTITDFDVSTGVDGGVRDDNDYVDLTQFYNEITLAEWNAANPGEQYSDPLQWMQGDQADGTLDGAGGLRVLDGGAAVAGDALTTENTGVSCFTKGTLIATARGEVPVENLQLGDFVQTMDQGLQPVRWIGNRHLDNADLVAHPNLRPIRISSAAMGLNENGQDLVVSPQHRMLVTSKIAEKMIGETEVLVAAKKMLDLDGIEVDEEATEVTYYHVLFNHHEIVFANGMPAETLYLGNEALKSLSPEGAEEIRLLFPELMSADFAPRSCRKIASGRQAKNLCSRHAKNHKPLQADDTFAHAEIVPADAMVAAANGR